MVERKFWDLDKIEGDRDKRLEELEREIYIKAKNTGFDIDNLIKGYYPLYYLEPSPLARSVKAKINALRAIYKK